MAKNVNVNVKFPVQYQVHTDHTVLALRGGFWFVWSSTPQEATLSHALDHSRAHCLPACTADSLAKE